MKKMKMKNLAFITKVKEKRKPILTYGIYKTLHNYPRSDIISTSKIRSLYFIVTDVFVIVSIFEKLLRLKLWACLEARF